MVVATREVESSIRPGGENFLAAIGRSDLHTVLTPKKPWVVYSAEVYLQKYGFVGNGGLGILMGDMLLQAQKLGLPFVGVTSAYPLRLRQRLHLDHGFYQQDIKQELPLPEVGLEPVNNRFRLKVKANSDTIPLSLYKAANGLPLYALHEPGLQQLYAGSPDGDHRVYQQAVLGFGGAQAIKRLGLHPAVTHLNESAAVFGALSQLDQRCVRGQSLPHAIARVRRNTLFTNHSLVPAASGSLSPWQLEHYVMPNLRSEEVKDWVRSLANQQGGTLNLGNLSMALAGELNGVSRLHSEIASSSYRHMDGSAAVYNPITNGIFMDRWVAPQLMRLYRGSGSINEFDLPAISYEYRLAQVDDSSLRVAKQVSRVALREYLMTRQDQYGQPIRIPEEAVIACWSKRFAGYKRPEMLFADISQLREILEINDIHVLLAGKVHSTDHPMKATVQEIMWRVHSDEILKNRVHLIQDYDEFLAEKMIPGVDIWCNTPRVGEEACGTSWEKAITNLAILISTEDGGVADCDLARYLRIARGDYRQEVRSLYEQFKLASRLVRSPDVIWGRQVKGQLSDYLPIISGARMLQDYVELRFPRPIGVDSALTRRVFLV